MWRDDKGGWVEEQCCVLNFWSKLDFNPTSSVTRWSGELIKPTLISHSWTAAARSVQGCNWQSLWFGLSVLHAEWCMVSALRSCGRIASGILKKWCLLAGFDQQLADLPGPVTIMRQTQTNLHFLIFIALKTTKNDYHPQSLIHVLSQGFKKWIE